MILGAFNLSLFEIIILQAGAVILGITIYFFILSRRSLSKTLEQSKSKSGLKSKPPLSHPLHIMPDPLLELQQQLSKVKTTPSSSEKGHKPNEAAQPSNKDYQTILSLKDSVLRQQESLDSLLSKIDALEEEKGNEDDLQRRTEELLEEIENLETKLEVKESELIRLRQQEAAAQKMAVRIEEVYKELDTLQRKLTSLETQAGNANALSLELEDMKESYEQLRKDLVRKQEKLEETVAENYRLQTTLNEVEDKLAESNLQRQQLHKKVLFLTDMNADLQNMSETNHKLQKELRRIGELESMLNMIAEERDQLMKRASR